MSMYQTIMRNRVTSFNGIKALMFTICAVFFIAALDSAETAEHFFLADKCTKNVLNDVSVQLWSSDSTVWARDTAWIVK